MSQDTRYRDYFAEAFVKAGEMDAAARKTLVQDLLTNVETTLKDGKYPESIIASEMTLARTAADAALAGLPFAVSRPEFEASANRAIELESQPAKTASESVSAESLLADDVWADEAMAEDPKARFAVSEELPRLEQTLTPPSGQTPATPADEELQPLPPIKPLYALLAALALVIYLLPLIFFVREGVETPPPDNAGAHELALQFNIGAADPAKETITFHISPVAGGLFQDNGRLGADTIVTIDAGTGPLTHTFPANAPIVPWTLTVVAESGDILNYPFDSYDAEVEVGAKSNGRNLNVTTALDHVPHGLSASRAERTNENGEATVTFNVRRSGSLIFVAFLSTLSVLLITIAACAVAWHVAYAGRKIEFSMMTWTAALLFVIPAVRNGLPGTPPQGALIDVVLFFWLQIVVVASLASLVLIWVRRA